MADKSISVSLRALTGDYQARMAAAAASTKSFGREAAGLAATQDQTLRPTLDRVGMAMTAIGVATAAAAGLSVKAAIDWETAWTGVTKTVDGSASEMAALEGELRGLAQTLPATHAEIAGVAEAAGQLGVERENVAAFTKTMIDLGETTNLTADQAATSMARMANIMGTPQSAFDRLGSTVVELGNNLATTEAEIVEMSLRIAGAGNIIGMSEAQVMGLAGALSSVGINAEAGGSAISKVMIEMASSVDEGGDKLAMFAEVAGMSTEQFAAAFRDDAAGALVTFIEGLGGVEAAGGSLFGVLEELDIKEVRMRDALLRTAGAGDLLRESIDLGTQAWEDNSALTEEAEKRYATTAAQLEILRNNVVDLAIEFGEKLMPAIRAVAEFAGDLLDGFRSLPGPMQTMVAVGAGLVGIMTGLGGAFLLLAPRVRDAHQAFIAMKDHAPRLAAALGKGAGIAGTLGIVAAAAGVAAIAADKLGGSIVNAMRGAPPAVDELALAFEGLQAAGEVPASVADAMDGLGQAIERVADPQLTDNLWGPLNSPHADNAREKVEAIDGALAMLVSSGNMEGAARGFDEVARMAADSGVSLEDLDEMLPGYAQAMDAAEIETLKVADASKEMAEAVAEVPTEFEALSEQLGITAEDLGKVSSILSGFVDPVGTYKSMVQELAQATADGTEDASDSWSDYADSVDVSLSEFTASLEQQIEDQREWERNLLSIARSGREGLAQQLLEMGPEAAGLVADAVDGTSDELDRLEEVMGTAAEIGTNAHEVELRLGLQKARATVKAESTRAAQAANQYREFHVAGAASGQGYQDGLESTIANIAAKARELASGAVNAAKNILGIQSPSKVFYELGEQTVRGYVDALDDNAWLVEDRVSAVINGAISSAGNLIAGLRASLGTGDARRDLEDARDELAHLVERRRLLPGLVRDAKEALDIARQQGESERDVADAEKTLNELLEEKAGINDEIRQARDDLTEAQLRAVDAEKRLLEAGQDLIGQGPAAEALFADLATAAGLTRSEIDKLIAKYRELQEVATGQQAAAKSSVDQAQQSTLSGALNKIGVNFGSRVDDADLRNAFSKIGHDPGDVIDESDLDVLLNKAKKMHSGGMVVGGGFTGLRYDEVPAILQTGERVLSRSEAARTETHVRVFIGDRELTDIVHVEVNDRERRQRQLARAN